MLGDLSYNHVSQFLLIKFSLSVLALFLWRTLSLTVIFSVSDLILILITFVFCLWHFAVPRVDLCLALSVGKSGASCVYGFLSFFDYA